MTRRFAWSACFTSLSAASILAGWLLLSLTAPVHAWPKGGNGGGGNGGGPGGGDPDLPTFTFQSLGTLGGSWSTADGINTGGAVVGVSELGDGTTSPGAVTRRRSGLACKRCVSTFKAPTSLSSRRTTTGPTSEVR